MKTHGVQYLGSKAKIVDHIADLAVSTGAKSAIDIFTGTTRVAQALRQKGIACHTTDLAPASRAYSSAFIKQTNTSHLQSCIDYMNQMEGIDGWLTQNYSGGDKYQEDKGEGRYIHPKNARKADAAREYVESLPISFDDKNTLICSIIFAINAVNNSVGQQQAYLKEWCDRSLKDIKFELPPIVDGPSGLHFEGDCFKVGYPNVDLAYLDPPYTPTRS